MGTYKSYFFFLGLVLLLVFGIGYFFGCRGKWCFAYRFLEAKRISSFQECMDAGFPVQEFYPRRCIAGGKTFIEEPDLSPVSSKTIKVYQPKPGNVLGLALFIKGEARVFENTVNYRLRDEDGSPLIEGHTTAQSPDIGQWGPFEVKTSYKKPAGKVGTVEVFEISAKDGSEVNKIEIFVKF